VNCIAVITLLISIIFAISLISISLVVIRVNNYARNYSREIDIVDTIQVIENYYKSKAQEKSVDKVWEEFATPDTKLKRNEDGLYDPSKVPGSLDDMFKGK